MNEGLELSQLDRKVDCVGITLTVIEFVRLILLVRLKKALLLLSVAELHALEKNESLCSDVPLRHTEVVPLEHPLPCIDGDTVIDALVKTLAVSVKLLPSPILWVGSRENELNEESDKIEDGVIVDV